MAHTFASPACTQRFALTRRMPFALHIAELGGAVQLSGILRLLLDPENMLSLDTVSHSVSCVPHIVCVHAAYEKDWHSVMSHLHIAVSHLVQPLACGNVFCEGAARNGHALPASTLSLGSAAVDVKQARTQKHMTSTSAFASACVRQKHRLTSAPEKRFMPCSSAV